MISKIPENLERQFIIRFYLIDDSISIFELTKRNSGNCTTNEFLISFEVLEFINLFFSGFRRCSFLKKMPVMLPKQEIFSSKKPEYYKPSDFYIGACLNINEFYFSIISADIYALRYMEINSKVVKIFLRTISTNDFIQYSYKLNYYLSIVSEGKYQIDHGKT